MTLELAWFCLIGLALAVYIVLDGFDIGVGIIHRIVARSPEERRLTQATIGPVWDGNEVWLLAAGGTLFLAFPKMYAVAIGGFYLPVQMLLWLFIGRALGIEMKHHAIGGPVWAELWDTIFSLSSLAIAVFLGVALGNVVRGVDFYASGRFFAPLWTGFSPFDARVGILDVYTLLIGATAATALAFHGALWLYDRTQGPVAERSSTLARKLFVASAALVGLTSAATLYVQPLALDAVRERPALLVFPVAAAGALVLCRVEMNRGRSRRAFLASSAFLGLMFATAAASLYPNLLPTKSPSASGLTVENAAASSYALGVGLIWYIPGLLLTASYFFRNYRRLPERLSTSDLDAHHD